MDCLLLGGAQSVGKSEGIYRLTKHLLSIGFSDVTNSVPQTFADFRAVLEGLNKSGKRIRIIINTATDTVEIINDFKLFFDNNGTYDILISSVRDDNFWPRNDFFRIMNLNNGFVLEIPLAKITRRSNNFSAALNWYQEKIDKLIIHIMGNNPFDI
jgi:hypothetical protein